jgi:hypothetical protein
VYLDGKGAVPDRKTADTAAETAVPEALKQFNPRLADG